VQKPENMYKTGHAFTYLLLKDTVANDIINVIIVCLRQNYVKNLKC